MGGMKQREGYAAISAASMSHGKMDMRCHRDRLELLPYSGAQQREDGRRPQRA
jgi:hypothetical protein